MSLSKDRLTEDSAVYLTRVVVSGVVGLGSLGVIANVYLNPVVGSVEDNDKSIRIVSGRMTARGLIQTALRPDFLKEGIVYVPGKTEAIDAQGNEPEFIIDTVVAEKGKMRITAVSWNEYNTQLNFSRGSIKIESSEQIPPITTIFNLESEATTGLFNVSATNLHASFGITSTSISSSIMPIQRAK